jgi:hypothetical protein
LLFRFTPLDSLIFLWTNLFFSLRPFLACTPFFRTLHAPFRHAPFRHAPFRHTMDYRQPMEEDLRLTLQQDASPMHAFAAGEMR